MLELLNINKSYKKKQILNSVSFSVKKGEIIAIIGPSGAGKTTLLRCISLLENLESGIIQFEDNKWNFPCKKPMTKGIYPSLTVVFQQHFLWPNMSNKSNVQLALKNKMNGNTNSKLLNDLVKKLCLTDVINRYPNEISVGEKQRVGLLRALVLEPKMLLLDEITSALDTRNIKIIENILLELKNNDTGIIAVTHNIDFAKRVADRVIYIEDGFLLEDIPTVDIEKSKCQEFKKFLNGEF